MSLKSPEKKSKCLLADPAAVRGSRVLVVEDGPTITHGGMPYGAGYVAARFEYPNDGPIADAADRFAMSLMRLKQMGVQRVDIGLTQMGFKTDKYRVVFFGKPDEIEKLAASHPELAPYLPLKIAIFAEQNQTLVVATSPHTLGEFFPDLNLDPILDKWTQDLDSIFDAVRIKE